MRTTNIDVLIQACEHDLEIVAQEARIIHVLLIGPLCEEMVVSCAEALGWCYKKSLGLKERLEGLRKIKGDPAAA